MKWNDRKGNNVNNFTKVFAHVLNFEFDCLHYILFHTWRYIF